MNTPQGVTDVRVFCGGCLVVQIPPYETDRDAPGRLAGHPAFADWPLVVMMVFTQLSVGTFASIWLLQL